MLTAAVILVVSLVNVAKLAGGGAAVARMIGAREVARDTRDPLERRLLNVVEEMAIASGIRAPAVYVMDGEKGINAFAAGYDVSNTVVAVTHGALTTLTRDELQGIIGHEFSHILNADIRLDISMIGVLAGILFLSAIGVFMMRNARGKAALIILAVGLGLFIIGYVGLFFGRIIKAAVSRQREFLADASSVQFTRNPDGIAGALDQIRASTALISSRRAEDLSHMFFVQGIRVWLGALFDTHPPIDERIERVHPGFQAAPYRQRRALAAPAAGRPVPAQAAGFSAPGPVPIAEPESRRTGDLASAWASSPEESAKLVGTLDAGKVDFASRLLAGLPAPLREQMRDAEGARAVLIALLFASDDEVMQGQVQALESTGLRTLAERAKSCVALTRPLGPAFHLPVMDLALPAVKSSSDKAKLDLLAALDAVIHADRRVSLHEFVVWTLVRTQLGKPTPPRAPKYRSVAHVRDDALRVLGLIAYAGQTAAAGPGSQIAQAFAKGAAEMGLEHSGAPGRESLSLKQVSQALEKLKDLAPLAKAVLIKGLFAAVTADGKIRVAEAELMRLVGAVLDCPLPPLFESLDPAAVGA
jgi:Zn-dependent protease with chaperone function